MKPSEQSGGFVVFDNLGDIECAVLELLALQTMVGNQFVNHLGAMDLTSKSIFINKDTNKRCESKA